MEIRQTLVAHNSNTIEPHGNTAVQHDTLPATPFLNQASPKKRKKKLRVYDFSNTHLSSYSLKKLKARTGSSFIIPEKSTSSTRSPKKAGTLKRLASKKHSVAATPLKVCNPPKTINIVQPPKIQPGEAKIDIIKTEALLQPHNTAQPDTSSTMRLQQASPKESKQELQFHDYSNLDITSTRLTKIQDRARLSSTTTPNVYIPPKIPESAQSPAALNVTDDLPASLNLFDASEYSAISKKLIIEEMMKDVDYILPPSEQITDTWQSLLASLSGQNFIRTIRSHHQNNRITFCRILCSLFFLNKDKESLMRAPITLATHLEKIGIPTDEIKLILDKLQVLSSIYLGDRS